MCILLWVLTYSNVHIHPAVDLSILDTNTNSILVDCVDIKKLGNPKKENDNVARILLLCYLSDGRLKTLFVTRCR